MRGFRPIRAAVTSQQTRRRREIARIRARAPPGPLRARRLAVTDGVHDVPPPEESSTPRDSLRRVLGNSYGAVEDLGVAARDVVPVALESVIGESGRVALATA